MLQESQQKQKEMYWSSFSFWNSCLDNPRGLMGVRVCTWNEGQRMEIPKKVCGVLNELREGQIWCILGWKAKKTVGWRAVWSDTWIRPRCWWKVRNERNKEILMAGYLNARVDEKKKWMKSYHRQKRWVVCLRQRQRLPGVCIAAAVQVIIAVGGRESTCQHVSSSIYKEYHFVLHNCVVPTSYSARRTPWCWCTPSHTQTAFRKSTGSY